MTSAVALLVFITLQRGIELLWARRNETQLRAKGAIEVGAGHYPLIVALHATWLVTLWLMGQGHALVPLWTWVFAGLQMMRLWVLWTLKGRWTARVLVVPGESLIARGPYRFIPHPNYLVVALEIPAAPLALGLPVTALAFGLANLAMLAWRIRVEGRALALADGTAKTA